MQLWSFARIKENEKANKTFTFFLNFFCSLHRADAAVTNEYNVRELSELDSIHIMSVRVIWTTTLKQYLRNIYILGQIHRTFLGEDNK